MSRYAVTAPRNKQIKRWRGLLRRYAVTPGSKCVRACVREEGTGACMFSYRSGA
jgi:hypothetical protein